MAARRWLGCRWWSAQAGHTTLLLGHLLLPRQEEQTMAGSKELTRGSSRPSMAGSRALTRVLLEHLAQLVGVHHILQAHLLALALLGARVGPHAAARKEEAVRAAGSALFPPQHSFSKTLFAKYSQIWDARGAQPAAHRHPTYSSQAPNLQLTGTQPSPRLTCSTWAAPSGPESEICWCPRS